MSRPRPQAPDRSPSATPPDSATPSAAPPAHGDADPTSAAPPSAPPVPMSAAPVLLGDDDAPFEALAADVRGRVGPGDAVGRLLAELVVIAAGRCRRAARTESQDDLPGVAWCRYQAMAERNLRAAVKELDRHLDRAGSAPTAAPPAEAVAPGRPAMVLDPGVGPHRASGVGADAVSTPAGTRAQEARPESSPADGPAPDATPRSEAASDPVAVAVDWRRAIALVRSISEEWPLLTRLRLEVEEVVSWVADGHPEAEVLLRYPDLTPAELAACLACDAEGLCGPFDPSAGPYPPGLPVLDHLPDGRSG